jgi:hypothetical protein
MPQALAAGARPGARQAAALQLLFKGAAAAGDSREQRDIRGPCWPAWCLRKLYVVLRALRIAAQRSQRPLRSEKSRYDFLKSLFAILAPHPSGV